MTHADDLGPMNGKVILITGATFGIGKEAALALAKLGGTIVIVGRDQVRTAGTVEWLKAESGNHKIDSLLADLSLLSEATRVATEFKSKYQRLDVLLNNVGAIFTHRTQTAEGFEQTYALNHLGPFALTLRLLDVLMASQPARIINTSSSAHRQGHINFDDLQTAQGFNGLKCYGASKLANILFTRALARRLKSTKITVNALHPGVVGTGFGHNTPGLFKLLVSVIRPFLLSPAQGAATSIYLASSPDVTNTSGAYFVKCRPAKTSKEGEDQAVQERLWDISLEQTKLQPICRALSI
jgi:NAD(P)-dependent dehydrogenase (short-subunit alcohol dehydrogenase family)